MGFCSAQNFWKIANFHWGILAAKCWQCLLCSYCCSMGGFRC
uniref:Uncharacterized protein n=1 Tax=Rhizophora mucronata TaxID=61149 RepID=A0A2P2NTJ5_RHIMU